MEEHVDVVVVGAGLSGIGAACHLRRDCPEESVVVLEARERVGGTWDLFRYPGVRSDSSIFTLAYDFAPWRGRDAIVDGPEILAYLEDTARAYGVDGLVRLGHRAVAAEWSSEDARWRVRVVHGETTTTLVCRFLWFCTGYYRYDHGHRPALVGQEEFGGRVVHPQAWPSDLDVAGARVVVLGSGATAVTLVPALVALGAQVTMVQRSPSYVLSMGRAEPFLAARVRVVPVALLARAARVRGIGIQTASYWLSRVAPGLLRSFLLRAVARQLPPGYDVATHFTPRYDPWDQRVCISPDGDLFAAISSGAAEVVTGTVDRLTPSGVRISSGRELPADVLVPATGLELLALGEVTLVVDGAEVDPAQALAYRGMMLAGVPSCAFTVGHSAASWTLRADQVAHHVTRLLRSMRRRGIASVTPVPPTTPQRRHPLLVLRAGYVLRSADRMPSQGSRHPWVIRQNPVRERLAFALRSRTAGLRLVPERGTPARTGLRD